MTDYWKSLPRKFCEFCKCWITDNKPSIEFHERGKRHQENVEQKIGELRKKGQKDYEAKTKMASDIKKMNEAALKAYEKDIERNPALAKELERERLRNPPVTQPSVTIKKGKSKSAKTSQSKDDDKVYVWKQPHRRKSQTPSKYLPPSAVGPSPKPVPYGQWVPVEDSQPEVVDLQLPAQKEVSYQVVTTTAEPELTITEKTVPKTDDNSDVHITFKKRRLMPDTKRNIRRKLDDD